MILALTTLAFAAGSKININVNQDTFVISNEAAGYLINELVKAGYGNDNLYEALLALKADTNGAIDSLLTPAFLSALQNCPASSEIFTTKLRDVTSNGISVSISTDGTARYDDIEGRTYYGTYPTIGTDISGVGRGLFTHSTDSQAPLNAKVIDGPLAGMTTTYNAFAVGWSSPIVLDLSGTGKLDASGGKWLPHAGFVSGAKVALFDITGTGFESLVEWVGPNAGILLMPGETTNINGNSLFGDTNGYKDGYEKLATFDKNHDGKLTADELKGFNVWVDANGDGKATTSEIKSAQSLNITEIAVTQKNFQSSFVQDGKSKYTWDWFPTYIAVEKVKVAHK